MFPFFICCLVLILLGLSYYLLKSTKKPNVIDVVLNTNIERVIALPYKPHCLYFNKKLDVLFKIINNAGDRELIVFTKRGSFNKIFEYTNFNIEKNGQNKELNEYLQDSILATQSDIDLFEKAQKECKEAAQRQREKERANWFLAMHSRSNNLVKNLFKTYETEPDKYYLAPLTSVESIKNYMNIRGIKTDIPDRYITNAILLELEKRKKSN